MSLLTHRHFDFESVTHVLPDPKYPKAGLSYTHWVPCSNTYIVIITTTKGKAYKDGMPVEGKYVCFMEFDKDMEPTYSGGIRTAPVVISKHEGFDIATEVVNDTLYLVQMAAWTEPEELEEFQNAVKTQSSWFQNIGAPIGETWINPKLNWTNPRRKWKWKEIRGWRLSAHKLTTAPSTAPIGTALTKCTLLVDRIVPLVATDGVDPVSGYFVQETSGPVIHYLDKYTNSPKICVSADYFVNGIFGPNPEVDGGFGSHHHFFDPQTLAVVSPKLVVLSSSSKHVNPPETNPHDGFVVPTIPDKITGKPYLFKKAPPRSAEHSILSFNNKYYLLAADKFVGNLIVQSFDKDWNYWTQIYLKDTKGDVVRGNFPTGAVWDWDGEQVCIVYTDTNEYTDLNKSVDKKMWQNIHLARYDYLSQWKCLEDKALTEYTATGPIEKGEAGEDDYILFPAT